MPKILLSIDGTATTCQKLARPAGAGLNGNTYYHPGTCPHFRQYPSGNDPVCLVFQKDARTPRSLESAGFGLTKRLPECCAAEKDSGAEGLIQIQIEAGQESCECIPIIKFKGEPDPWINLTMGYETIYYPKQVCGHYVSFPNGSSWCRVYHQKVFRDYEGLSRRLPICLRAQRT